MRECCCILRAIASIGIIGSAASDCLTTCPGQPNYGNSVCIPVLRVLPTSANICATYTLAGGQASKCTAVIKPNNFAWDIAIDANGYTGTDPVVVNIKTNELPESINSITITGSMPNAPLVLTITGPQYGEGTPVIWNAVDVGSIIRLVDRSAPRASTHNGGRRPRIGDHRLR